MIIKIIDEKEDRIIEYGYCDVPEKTGRSLIDFLDSIIHAESYITSYVSDCNKEFDKYRTIRRIINEERRNNHE